jgi:predicted GIY-YIG superfamily endonuclease
MWEVWHDTGCVAVCVTEELALSVVNTWSFPGNKLMVFEDRLPTVMTEQDVRERRPYYVYIIRLGKDGRVKVGVTSNVDNRCKDIKTHSPEDIRVLALEGPYTRSAAFGQERSMKEQFRRWLVQGEWFAFSSDIAEWIATFRSANPHLLSQCSVLTNEEICDAN